LENFESARKNGLAISLAIVSVFEAIKASDCLPLSLLEFSSMCAPFFPSSKQFPSWHGFNVRQLEKLHVELLEKGKSTPRKCNFQPTLYVKSFAEQLQFPKRALGYACRLSEAIVEKRLNQGHSPNAIAAAVLSHTNAKFKPRLNKVEILGVAKCTFPTLRNAEIRLTPYFEEFQNSHE
jgi:hypothetical protein